jgi:hypothetical protein
MAQPVALWWPTSLHQLWQRNRKTKETNTRESRKQNASHCARGSASGTAVAAGRRSSSLRSLWQRNRKTKETKRTRSVKHCPRGSTSGPAGATAAAGRRPSSLRQLWQRNRKTKETKRTRGSLSIRVVHEQPLWLNQWRCGGPVHSGHCGKDKTKQKALSIRVVHVGLSFLSRTGTVNATSGAGVSAGPIHVPLRRREE